MATRNKAKRTSGIPLTLEESDLDPIVRGTLRAPSRGRVLGTGDKSKQILFDALPAAIAKKVQRILPDGFELKEIEMKISLAGALFGVGLTGDMKVRFSPSK